MFVTAVSSFFNPYDVAQVANVRTKADQAETRNQPSAQQAQPERLIQGEVVSRQALQNNKLTSTNDALSNRQFTGQQSGFGFNANQAINTYIANQQKGVSIDNQTDDDQIVDIYV